MSFQPPASVIRQPEVTPLPRSRAFMLRLSTDAGQARITGRIEHVMSGQATRFESWEELRSFIEQILGREDEKPP